MTMAWACNGFALRPKFVARKKDYGASLYFVYNYANRPNS